MRSSFFLSYFPKKIKKKGRYNIAVVQTMHKPSICVSPREQTAILVPNEICVPLAPLRRKSIMVPKVDKFEANFWAVRYNALSWDN